MQPAFPSVCDTETKSILNFGMTLRDYFAAKAMPIVLSEFFEGIRNQEFQHPGPDWREYLAQDVYKIADAMLKQREL